MKRWVWKALLALAATATIATIVASSRSEKDSFNRSEEEVWLFIG